MCAHIRKFMVFIAFAAPKNVDALFSWVTALFFSLQNGQTGPISLLSLSGHSSEIFPARVSSDNPRLKAFCRVAPSVLLNLRAISAARLLLRASLFNVRICSAVHARRLFICPLTIKVVGNFTTIPRAPTVI